MARLGVTYQDIARAADQIIGQGRQPTIELIRHLLGTGSTTTIANHLRKWRAEQDGSTSVAIKENLPQEFISVMKGLWQRLQAHADSQVAVIKQESELAYQRLLEEIEKYKTNNQRWQKMYEGWSKEKDALSRDKLALQQAISSLQTEHVTLNAKLDVEHKQINEKQQRIDELHRLHKLAQENLEHYRESARVQRLIDQEKHAQQMQQLELSLKNMQQQCIIASQDKILLQNNLDKCLEDYVLLRTVHDKFQNEYSTLQSLFSKMEKEQGDVKHEAFHWKQQGEKLQAKMDEQQQILLEQQKQHAVASQQLVMARAEIDDLKEQNKFLAREKWEIAQEKAQLEGINKQMEKMIYPREGAVV